MVLWYYLARRLCGFSSFWLKRHWIKKDPSWYCGTVPLQEPVGGFSSGRGGELMRTHKREQTLWVRVHAPEGNLSLLKWL